MNERILAKLASLIQDLPPLPAVAQEVLTLLSDPDTSPDRLQEAISRDPALSLKMLRTSNSAYYRRGKEITSINDAIKLLGFKTVQSLVMSSAVHRVLSAAGQVAERLWEHSFAVAVACRELGRATGLSSAACEEVFLAGLFHDVGKGVIADKFPGIYAQPLGSEGEAESLGFHHAHLGQVLLTKWEIPAALVNAVGQHHDPEPEGFAAYVVMANWLTQDLAPGVGEGERPRPAALLDSLGLDEARIDEISEKIELCLREERGEHGRS